MSSPAPVQLRDALADTIRRDLLGPANGPDEELHKDESHVFARYLVGALAPRDAARRNPLPPEEDAELAAAGIDDVEGGKPDTAAAVPNFYPSSLGLSFTVDGACKELQVLANWGRYERVKSLTQTMKDGSPAMVWKRTPMEGRPWRLRLMEGGFKPYAPCNDQPDVIIEGRARKSETGWLVTLFLVNLQAEPDRLRDEAWLFQPELIVTGQDHAPVFVQRLASRKKYIPSDPLAHEELQDLAMRYRHRREFAVGHGISVHADGTDGIRAKLLRTTYLPEHELRPTTARSAAESPKLADVVLDMQILADMPVEALATTLEAAAAAYSDWIDDEAAKAESDELEAHRDAARRAVVNCRRVLERYRAGIDLLKGNSQALAAFRFANRSMALQRVRSMLARAVRKREIPPTDDAAAFDIPENRSWRLFQLVFMVMNLPSLTELDHPERSESPEAVADLLWFATGGGKTEAYLGLTAYTLAIRRLQGTVAGHDGHHGVAVLMRYTLRLLTLQQFQRAAALICACEVLRQQDATQWGKEVFRLGLWVGVNSTPNKLAAAKEAIQSLHRGQHPGKGSPHQLTSCPWCGREIKPVNLRIYEAPLDIGRCVTYCGDDLGSCVFSEARSDREGIPIMVVDEEIYRRPPAVLIATVDKFAQMPWKGEAQMLFGKVTAECARHGFVSPETNDAQSHPATKGFAATKNKPHAPLRPPDLIIQDELHLVSGPLGSMVGLYEAAIDSLCEWQVDGRMVRPKVIASTATVRRAADQVSKLFARRLEVFPPQGTSAEDNFFAVERADLPGRRYIGICGFGRRYPASLIRTYVAALGGAQLQYETHGKAADGWMTAVGYFNSMRELAGTRRLSDDDIRARLRDADTRGLGKRRIAAVEELTSRKSGTDIPKILERLEAVFDPALLDRRKKEIEQNRRSDIPLPYDIVLATNMISVGVDIDRLGLMVVAGQPKNTAEYIQSTSRVGRSKAAPGLVLTLFNWARPRDLSHYERFEHYHDTLYQHVEALSVTPFAPRALDRGLAGVMVSMLRLQDDHLNPNLSAGELHPDERRVPAMIAALSKRVRATGETSAVAAYLESEAASKMAHWYSRIDAQAEDHQLAYKSAGDSVIGLLESPKPSGWEPFTCLDSLRDVE